MSQRALIAAREALIGHGAECKDVNDALALIDEALAAPVHEPVGRVLTHKEMAEAAKRYTTPPAAPVQEPCTICGATDHKETCDSPGAIITRSTGCPAHDQTITPPAAPVQEPVAAQCRFPAVAWAQCDVEHARMVMANPHEWKGYEVRLLYTTPPAAQRQSARSAWVGLTDEEIFETHKQVDSMQYLTFGKAIEAKLREKNSSIQKEN
jgi:hypothetical protein